MNPAHHTSASAPAQASQRLFIAIPCPPVSAIGEALKELRTIAARSSSGLHVVNGDRLHVTLKFLGSTPPSLIPAICEALDAQVSDIDAFTLELAGAGCFPGVLWLGIRPHSVLTALAGGIENRMQALGFQAETRSFHPHVTLARVKRTADFEAEAWQQHFYRTAWGKLPVTAINLYRSVTRPGGADYSVVHAAILPRTEHPSPDSL